MPFDGKDLKYIEPFADATEATNFAGASKLKRLFGLGLWSLAATVVGRQAYAVPQRFPESSEVVAAQLLRSARAMIDREEMWVQGRYNARGGRHCAIGALRAAGRFYHSETLRLAHALLHNVANSRGFDSVEKMNDASTHAQVLAAFNSAIASAEAIASARTPA
jgi:hypothetical protein